MNRHQSINLRQLCIGYFLYSISIKILTLPSALAQGAGGWAWLSAGLGVAFEIATVALATLILKFTDSRKPFFRGLCFVLVPCIIAELWVNCLQIYHLAYTDLFTNLSMLIFIITLLLLAGFFLTRQPRAVFRAGEIVWLLFAFGLVLAIAPTLYNLRADWSQLVVGDWRSVFATAGGHLLFFESASFVLVFGSETKKTGDELRKINWTALACGLGYFAMIILFIILFGTMAVHKTMGLVEFTSASQFLTTTGSLDWLITIAVLSVLVLRFGVQLVAIVTLIKRGLNRK